MELTWTEFETICQKSKSSKFKPPDSVKVKEEICDRLGVENDELLHEQVAKLIKRHVTAMNSKNKKTSSERSNQWMNLD